MNQIICTSSSNIEDNPGSIYIPNKKLKIFLLKITFYISVIIAICTIAYYLYFRYTTKNLEQLSKEISDNLKITKLYTSSSDYYTNSINEDIFFYDDTSFSVIGNIKIDKLNISYPILSSINKDYLKIAPCRFYGPLLNEVRKCLHSCT